MSELPEPTLSRLRAENRRDHAGLMAGALVSVMLTNRPGGGALLKDSICPECLAKLGAAPRNVAGRERHLRTNSGSLAIFAAIRRGSLLAIIDAISC